MVFDGIKKLKKTNLEYISEFSRPRSRRIVYICKDENSKYYNCLFVKECGFLKGVFLEDCIKTTKKSEIIL